MFQHSWQQILHDVHSTTKVGTLGLLRHRDCCTLLMILAWSGRPAVATSKHHKARASGIWALALVKHDERHKLPQDRSLT